MMIFPLFLPDTSHLSVERLMVAVILILALWAAGTRPRTLLLFVPVLIAYLLVLNLGGLQFRAVAVGIRASFFAYATVLIVQHTVRAPTVTGNTIAGAACAYLLTAMTWANFYEILELLRPGSFGIPANLLLPPSGDPSFALQYFSFTTLTTVGYGDIHPHGSRRRSGHWRGRGGPALRGDHDRTPCRPPTGPEVVTCPGPWSFNPLTVYSVVQAAWGTVLWLPSAIDGSSV